MCLNSRTCNTFLVATSVTCNDLIQRTGVTQQDLERECSPKKLRTLSEHIFNWKILADDLELSPAEIFAIKTDPFTAKYGAREVLNRWHEKNGFDATYKILVDVMLRQSNVSLAQNICILAKGEYYNNNNNCVHFILLSSCRVVKCRNLSCVETFLHFYFTCVIIVVIIMQFNLITRRGLHEGRVISKNLTRPFSLYFTATIFPL